MIFFVKNVRGRLLLQLFIFRTFSQKVGKGISFLVALHKQVKSSFKLSFFPDL